jgi:hypothetical protein
MSTLLKLPPSFRYPNESLCIYVHSHACYMPYISHPAWFRHSNNIRRGAHGIMISRMLLKRRLHLNHTIDSAANNRIFTCPSYPVRTAVTILNFNYAYQTNRVEKCCKCDSVRSWGGGKRKSESFLEWNAGFVRYNFIISCLSGPHIQAIYGIKHIKST